MLAPEDLISNSFDVYLYLDAFHESMLGGGTWSLDNTIAVPLTRHKQRMPYDRYREIELQMVPEKSESRP